MVEGIIDDSISSCANEESIGLKKLTEDKGQGDNTIGMEIQSCQAITLIDSFRFMQIDLKYSKDVFPFIDQFIKHLYDFLDPLWMVDALYSFSQFSLCIPPLLCSSLSARLQPTCVKAHELVFKHIGIG